MFFTVSILLIAELVRWEEIYNSRRSLVRSEDSGSDSECSRQTNKRSRRATASTSNDEIHGKKPKSSGKYAYIKSETKALLLKYYCSPISSIRDVKEFRNDLMLSDPKNRDYVQSAFDDFGKDINELSMREIYNEIKDNKPLFILSMNYGNIDESTEVVEQLLRYQFDDDDEKIVIFLNTVIDILDKRIPKCNCICVHGPPSSGKNYFFDMILALCLNYGQLGCANKNNVFAFQEAPNKRVLLWNEPNYESAMTDTVKMMMGGDPYTVRVKHSMDTHVRRTPVIALTNNQVGFMYELAFKDRVVKFNWKQAPFLKNIEFKPYPISFYNILLKYNINFYILFYL